MDEELDYGCSGSHVVDGGFTVEVNERISERNLQVLRKLWEGIQEYKRKYGVD